MSTLRANTILNPSTNSPILNPTGNVVQVARVRYQTRTTISSNNTGNGTTITGLNLTLTPRSSNNRIICQWYIMGEMHHDNVFLIHRGGALITTTNEWGYNGDAGNSRWSGYVASTYDAANNNDSTPHNWFIQYSQIANTTVSTTWAPAVRSSSGTNYALHINKNIGNLGSDNRETGVSFGVIYEVTT
jgi:hypothetical protein